MALTATATYETRNRIIKALEMDDCKVIAMIPNKMNIYYAVLPLPSSPMCVLSPLIGEICLKGREANRTIVFCRSYDNLIELYTTTVLELGKRGKFYIEGSDPSDCRICDKYDACTALEVRQNIIRSFTNPDGNLRLIFATVAFSMGLDSPNVRRIIHWSAPSDLEMYVQESGRGGRDGEATVAVLYCSGKDRNMNEDMKLYCRNTSTCRRLMLMTAFGISSEIKQPSVPHECCDICSRTCSCFECTSVLLSFKSCTPDDLICDDMPPLTKTSTQRISRSIRDRLKEAIITYRSKSCMDVSCPTAALMVGVEICSGITNSMIDYIISRGAQITSVSDLIEIGIPANHADHILPIIFSHLKKDIK